MRVLLMLRGAPGCGKTTWIEKHGLTKYALSADDIRLLCASPRMTVDGRMEMDCTHDTIVWNTLFKILETRMQAGEFTVIDATNSKTTEMNRYKSLCDSYKYRMYCVDMTSIPINEVKRRNMSRPEVKRVPEEAIEKMYSRFATQKIPSGVTVITPDELEKIWMRKIDLSEYKSIHVVGDIHGCNTALQEYLGKIGGVHEDDGNFYIFCGDYIDRGLENAEVVRYLCGIKDFKNVLLLEGNHERWLWIWGSDGICPSKEFEFHTKPELEDACIDKKEARKLHRKIGQCAWFDYNGREYFISHGGIAMLPPILTTLATEQLIKGVGSYNDFEAVEAAWDSMTGSTCFQIHGHRNTKGLPIHSSDRNYNLEGRVEFGGCLRAIQLMPDGTVNEFEIENKVFKLPEETVVARESENKELKSVGDTILELRRNKYVTEKRFGNISSFNFTKSAFYDGVWDNITTKARGLYFNIPQEKVVCRGYEKFFNINERPETKFDMLQYKLQFPVTAYVKENGFLGMVSYNSEDGALFATTKSNPEGDAAVWLRQNLETLYKDKLDDIKEFVKENNVTMLFECVDMAHDPHIIKYPENRLYLLDIVYNDMKFRKYSYNELCEVAERLGLRVKERAYVIENWQDFYDWYYTVTDEDYLFHNRHIEGFVIEDASGYMVKLKLAYYNFWKFMRGISQETIRKGYIDRTSALATPLANHFYGWIKTFHADGNIAPSNDICTLRDMFYKSENGALFAETGIYY